MTEKLYGIPEVWSVRDEPPTAEFEPNRRIADALREIVAGLVRLKAAPGELEAMAGDLERIASSLRGREHHDHIALFQKLKAGEATRNDCEHLFDFEAFIGEAAAVAPPMRVWVEGGVVRATATVPDVYQGPPGRVHGGIIALMMDILLARVQEITRTLGVTGTLNIRYLAGTPLDTELQMEAGVVRWEGKKIFVEGKIYVNGQQTVQAEGIWISSASGVAV